MGAEAKVALGTAGSGAPRLGLRSPGHSIMSSAHFCSNRMYHPAGRTSLSRPELGRFVAAAVGHGAVKMYFRKPVYDCLERGFHLSMNDGRGMSSAKRGDAGSARVISHASRHGGVFGRFRCRSGYGADTRVRVQAIGMKHHTGGKMSDRSKVTARPAGFHGDDTDLGLTFWPYCVSHACTD